MPVSRRHFLAVAALAPVAFLGSRAAQADPARIYAEDGVAIDGTDAVAYFTQFAPVAGKTDFTAQYMGVTWQFSSAANRDLFAADPAAYAPQYGGYCAYAVSEGYTAPTAPDAWTIVDGKLYLNYSKSIRARWERDIPSRISAADANWPALLGS